MIYADYSSTSINKPKSVADAMANAVLCNMGNPSRSTNAFAINSLRTVDSARKTIAKFFGIEKYWNLGFTLNATHSLNIAIKGSLNKDDHVITSFWEHNSVLRPLYQVGASFSILPKDENGNPNTQLLEQMLKSNTKAIVLNIMSNVSGNIIDLEPVKEFAKKHNLLLILDASQAAGQVPIHINDSFPKTLLAFTGHKSLYGPMGVGGLISYGVDTLKPLMSGGTGINSFNKAHPSIFPDVCEAGTLNIPAILGLKAAIEWHENSDMDMRYKRIKQMRKYFIDSVKNIDNVILYSDYANGGATVAINIAGLTSQDTAMRLEKEYSILTRAGAHCAPLFHKEYNTVSCGMVRFSFGIATSDTDIEKCVYAIKNIATNKK